MADPDTTKPALSSLMLPTVDVTHGATTTAFSAGASDVGSGVDHVTLLFDKSYETNGYLLNGISLYPNGTAGQVADSQEFDSSTAAGTYNVTTAAVYDKAGNSTFYSASQLAAMGIATSFQVTDHNTAPTAQITAPASATEGLDSTIPLSLTLHNVTTASGTVTMSLDTADSVGLTGSDVSVPSFSGSYSVSQTPAGDYTIALPSIGITDDSVAEGARTIAVKITASGQVFDTGTDTTIVKIVLGDNDFSGTAGNDHLVGSAANDTFTASAGTDTIDGGAGQDTVVFSGGIASASFAHGAGGALIVTTANGVSTLTNIETLRFADGSVTLHGGNPLVDNLFYDRSNPDILAAGVDPATHYAQFGWHEGRDPDALFSTSGYEAVNGDVRAAGVNPLDHYDQSGWKEGRDPSAGFDTTLYLLHNPDVKAAGVDPLAHYLAYGQAEGRQAYAAIGTHIMADGFDPDYYLLANPDVAKAAIASGGDVDQFAFQHYEAYGWKEGRNPNAWFDDKGYLATYADVASAGVNPLDHYHDHGWKEGRDPSASFDTKQYLATYTDVAAANVDPLVHYLDYGAYELRNTFADGHFHI